jgi:hypothetical protein
MSPLCIIEVVIAERYCRMFFRDVIAGHYCRTWLRELLRGIIVGPSGFAERYIIAGWLRGRYFGMLMRGIIEGRYCGTLSRGIISGWLQGVIAGYYWGILLRDVIARQGFAARFCVMLLQNNIAGWISWEFLWGVIAGWLQGIIAGKYWGTLLQGII